MSRRFSAAFVDISPLRESTPYRALWLGQLVSLLGTNMRIVAVAWQVFAITGSTIAVGLVGLVEVVPLIAFSILGGAIVDTSDRKRLIIVTQLGMMVTSGALALLAFSTDPSVLWIYGVLAVGSAFSAVDRPARASLVPSLVSERHIPSTMALRQILFHTTTIVGPAIGGVIISAFDVKAVYLVDAVSFSAALFATRWLPSFPQMERQDETRLQTIKEGLLYAMRTPVLMSIFVIDLVAMIFGMPRAVFPALARETFDLGATGTGVLYSAVAAGAFIGAITTGWVKRVTRHGIAVLVSVTAWGVAIALAGLTTFSFVLTVLFLAFAGAADVLSAVFRGTILLESTPAHLQGRMNALNIMVVTGGPRVGDLEAGVAAGLVGVGPSIVLGGMACLVGTAAVGWAFPALRNYIPPRLRPGTSAPSAP